MVGEQILGSWLSLQRAEDSEPLYQRIALMQDALRTFVQRTSAEVMSQFRAKTRFTALHRK
jgi:hypothetical protein